MYFVMIRPQKKKQKEEQNMRDSIQVGDEITTIGGIMGRVVTVKEDSIIIEIGSGQKQDEDHPLGCFDQQYRHREGGG